MSNKEIAQKIAVGVVAAILGAYALKYLKGNGLL